MKQSKESAPKWQELPEKAEAILEGAMREFLAHGYAATSMDRVASAARVSKATVYSYFRDKKSLFNALVKHLASERLQSIFSMPSAELLFEKPQTVLRRMAISALDMAGKEGDLMPFMRLIVGESGRFPELAQAYVNFIAKPIIENLSRYFASRTELKLADPEASARVFIGTIVYFIIVQEVLHGKKLMPMKRERLVNHLVALITESDDESKSRARR
jgi:AcrR family transcriptional regulator